MKIKRKYLNLHTAYTDQKLITQQYYALWKNRCNISNPVIKPCSIVLQKLNNNDIKIAKKKTPRHQRRKFVIYSDSESDSEHV